MLPLVSVYIIFLKLCIQKIQLILLSRDLFQFSLIILRVFLVLEISGERLAIRIRIRNNFNHGRLR